MSHRSWMRCRHVYAFFFFLFAASEMAFPASVGFLARLPPTGASGGREVVIAAMVALPPTFVDGAATHTMFLVSSRFLRVGESIPVV